MKHIQAQRPNIRSLEEVEINGQKMPRWVAEKCGFLPVTITRCLRSLADGVTRLPRSWVYAPEDLSSLFQSERFLALRHKGEGGIFFTKDGFGNYCWAFWPHFINKR